MIGPRFQKRIRWLAFVAMALLVAMPTAGRLISAWSAGTQGPPAMLVSAHAHDAQAMPATRGMTGDMAGHAHHGFGEHQHFGICAYCPLLACLTILVLCLLRLLTAPMQRRTWQSLSIFWFSAGPLGSFGARGPPVIL